MTAVPTSGAVVAERRHRRVVVVDRAERVRADSADFVAAATRTCARAYETVQASSRVLADARRILAGRNGPRRDGGPALCGVVRLRLT